jgi:hypothetical protein
MRKFNVLYFCIKVCMEGTRARTSQGLISEGRQASCTSCTFLLLCLHRIPHHIAASHTYRCIEESSLEEWLAAGQPRRLPRHQQQQQDGSSPHEPTKYSTLQSKKPFRQEFTAPLRLSICSRLVQAWQRSPFASWCARHRKRSRRSG